MDPATARHIGTLCLATRAKTLVPGRLSWLMGLYQENHLRLARLFAPHRLPVGVYQSSVDDGLDLRLSVQARHPYTLEIGLSYCMLDEASGRPTPSVQVRSYLDANVTEALHCEPDRDLWQVLGPFPSARSVMQHRLRMNTFLNRWLEYLAGQGHSLGTLQRCPTDA